MDSKSSKGPRKKEKDKASPKEKTKGKEKVRVAVKAQAVRIPTETKTLFVTIAEREATDRQIVGVRKRIARAIQRVIKRVIKRARNMFQGLKMEKPRKRVLSPHRRLM